MKAKARLKFNSSIQFILIDFKIISK